MNVTQYITDNWAGIVFFAIVITTIIVHFIKKHRKAKRENKSERTVTPLVDESLFGEMDTTGSLYEQRKNAERMIADLQRRGKMLVTEKHGLAYQYQEDNKEIRRKQQELGMKYTMWKNQLELINNMIANQEQMEREYNK